MLSPRIQIITPTLNNLVLVFLILSPLIYANDKDPYRGFEVIFVAAIGAGFVLFKLLRGFRFWPETVFLLLYGLILISQQLVINDGSILFGAQYAIHMALMFVPLWALRATQMSVEKFSRTVNVTLGLIALITVITIYSSFLFGIGEVYTSEGLTRAFGWLGDSFTPIIVLLITYFYFQKQWLRAGALFGALIMTGGKAGIIMLVVTPVLYFLLLSESLNKKIVILLFLAAGSFLTFTYRDNILQILVQNYEYSFNNRAYSIAIGIDYFLQNPWFGVGINQSMKLLYVEADSFISFFGGNSYPINQIYNPFIRSAAETGIFGLLTFAAICSIWIFRSAQIFRRAYKWPFCPSRSIAKAGSLWTISFILFYQTTSWFEVGHPQLAWLLIIMAVAEFVYISPALRAVKVPDIVSNKSHNPQFIHSLGP